MKLSEQVAELEARVSVDADACRHLANLMNRVWGEACYDPQNDSTQAFAATLMDDLTALNLKWKFRK